MHGIGYNRDVSYHLVIQVLKRVFVYAERKLNVTRSNASGVLGTDERRVYPTSILLGEARHECRFNIAAGMADGAARRSRKESAEEDW
jgi:hypothetical protein